MAATATLVGGALLSAFLQVAFDRLASRQVLDFFGGRKLDINLLKKLKLKLRSIDAVADDAELKQFRYPRVKEWLADVKDAVFQAEDLFDEIYHLSKCEVEAGSQSTDNEVWNFLLSPFSFFKFENEDEIETRMKQVLDDLDKLANEGGRLGLKEASDVASGSGSKVSHKSPSTSLVAESVICGREDEKKKIYSGCHNLQMISQGHAHNHLKHLEIWNCPKVEAFPDGGLPSNLKRMDLYNCSKLVASLKGTWGPNPSLEVLNIGEMDAECFPEEGMLPVSLTSLTIDDCRDLKQVDYRGLCHLSSLKELCLDECPLLQCLPEEGLPKSISTLRIWNCPLLECLPEVGLPKSISTLDIQNCPLLECLPEVGLPKSISTLLILKCPLLRQRCQKPEGEDWPKIAHIERLFIPDSDSSSN